jgi:hypothetical protein
MTDEERAKDLQKYLCFLAQDRLPWEPAIDNIIAYVNHGRRFINNWDNYDGQQTGQAVYDDTAMLARNKLRDGMVGYLCSRNQPWFALELPGKFNFPKTSSMRAWSGERVDSYPQVQQWLQDSQEVMYSAFNRSNFYDVNTEFISDGATCGTATIVIEEEMEHARIVFLVPHFRETYIAENQFGEVDTNYRVFKMTLKQLREKFGSDMMEKADENFKRDYESNMYSEREILHAIYPRKDLDPSRIDAKNKPWASVWVYRKGGCLARSGNTLADNTGGATIVGEGGYDSQPTITWRWRKNNDEVYGRGPAHDAFVSIAKINQMGRTNLITAQRAAQPPLVAPADLRGAIQRGPDGVTYVERNRGDIRTAAPFALVTGVQNLPFSIEFEDRVAAVINEHFHTDVFQMMSQLAGQGKSERMVEEQVRELQGEKAAILGTRVGNLQSEAFDPIILRVYSIEAQAGRIPTPPDILLESQHGPVTIQYLGPLAQAQNRLTTVRSIQAFLSGASQVAQFDPTVTHYVDSQFILQTLRDGVSAPVACIRSAKEIQAIQQSLNQQAQRQETAENVPKLAKAAAALSKAPEAGSILKQLMGGQDAGA